MMCNPWGCTKSSNQLIFQRRQNELLRLITKAYCDVINDLHEDMTIKTSSELIPVFTIKHKKSRCVIQFSRIEMNEVQQT